jgi:ubiquitin-like protein Nedd8
VLEVKQMLQESVGVEVPMIRLIFSGKQLNDEQKIKDCNVTAGSVIHMVLQLRG